MRFLKESKAKIVRWVKRLVGYRIRKFLWRFDASSKLVDPRPWGIASVEYELVSCHQVIIEDADGEVVDCEYYCSDFCARGSDSYAGWNGCVEVSGPQWCEGCGDKL